MKNKLTLLFPIYGPRNRYGYSDIWVLSNDSRSFNTTREYKAGYCLKNKQHKYSFSVCVCMQEYIKLIEVLIYKRNKT
jgi:hypothetical protein